MKNTTVPSVANPGSITTNNLQKYINTNCGSSRLSNHFKKTSSNSKAQNPTSALSTSTGSNNNRNEMGSPLSQYGLPSRMK